MSAAATIIWADAFARERATGLAAASLPAATPVVHAAFQSAPVLPAPEASVPKSPVPKLPAPRPAVSRSAVSRAAAASSGDSGRDDDKVAA